MHNALAMYDLSLPEAPVTRRFLPSSIQEHLGQAFNGIGIQLRGGIINSVVKVSFRISESGFLDEAVELLVISKIPLSSVHQMKQGRD